eukprot:s234_g19.t1
MCQNKSKGLGGAMSMTEFPLTTYSLKPFLCKVLLPFIYPLLLNYGILLLGCPGVGKTPFAIFLAMAIGRYHVRQSGDQGLKPGWRRAKSLDNFRHSAPHVQEALFLDDPSRRKVSIADLKSFLTSDEDGTVDSRYNDTRQGGHHPPHLPRRLHKDLLADKDKPQYGKYKAGVLETGPAFDADVQREQAMIDDAAAENAAALEHFEEDGQQEMELRCR